MMSCPYYTTDSLTIKTDKIFSRFFFYFIQKNVIFVVLVTATVKILIFLHV